MKIYPTDLTDSQWSKIAKFFTIRKRKHPLREIINALLYIAKSGIQWRLLPKEYPRWELVYYYFRRWTSEGLIEEIRKKNLVRCFAKSVVPIVPLHSFYSRKNIRHYILFHFNK